MHTMSFFRANICLLRRLLVPLSPVNVGCKCTFQKTILSKSGVCISIFLYRQKGSCFVPDSLAVSPSLKKTLRNKKNLTGIGAQLLARKFYGGDKCTFNWRFTNLRVRM